MCNFLNQQQSQLLIELVFDSLGQRNPIFKKDFLDECKSNDYWKEIYDRLVFCFVYTNLKFQIEKENKR